MIIYADVLFVVNFFITYLLILLTGVLTKHKPKTWRALLSGIIGGFYSLVIFLDEKSLFLSLASKLVASAVIVFASFGAKRFITFIKRLAVFYFSNVVVLGFVMLVWLLISPKAVAVKNGSVYFNISALTLLLSALLAYIISFLIIKIHNKSLAKKEIYSIKIFKGDEKYRLYAFLDSGNRLVEPFTDYPVIIVDKNKISIEGDRIIPYNTVGGQGVLMAFHPDKIIINSGSKSVETDKVYIALGEVSSKEFSAILNPSILNV